MASVDRCVCHNLTFAQLKEMAASLDGDSDRLAKETGCGESCGMCRPYLQRMLETGETAFEVLRRPARPGLNILRRDNP